MTSIKRVIFNLLMCYLVVFLPCPVYSAQILGIAIHGGKSHFDFIRPVFLGLAKAGHNVTVFSAFPNKEPVENYTDLVPEGVEILTNVVNVQAFEKDTSFKMPITMEVFMILYSWGVESCSAALKSPHLKKILESGHKYDVVIVEQFSNDCMMAIPYLLGVPVISMSSCALMPWQHKRLGTPALPWQKPLIFLPHNERMNFMQRFTNFINFQIANFMYDFITQPKTNAMLRERFGSTMPPIEEIVKSTSLVLLNQHYSLAGAYAYTPNVIEVGGLQIQEEKPLDPKLKSLLDKSPPNGVIYISWGTMVRPETLSAQKKDDLMRVIAQFSDYLFLLKWPDNNLKSMPKNLITRSWMPQRDVLCHPKVRAFMTHGGLLGTSEGAYCGVPMLVTPFYGDQFLNSMAIINRKIGVIVEYKDFTYNNIINALKTILTPSYRAAALQVSESFRKRPIKPLDLAIWWVEQVIATNGVPLAQSASIEMNSFALNGVDIYLALLVITALVLWIAFVLLKFIFRMLRKFFGSKKQKAKTKRN